MKSMITVGVIRNGKTYLTQHLRRNDYWAEGEAQVQGEWLGQGADRLGLKGVVAPKQFEALRRNRHPGTGERLTRRALQARVAFFDVQFSAPKDVSVLALVGDDQRVRAAFEESLAVAISELERFAAVRERRGDAVGTEQWRLTGNVVGAKFIHDASRDLDPQLHAHVVLANATWDPERKAWFALQPAEMMRASNYVRQVFYRELSGRLQTLGYTPYELTSKGFSVRGVEHLRERYSKRARHVQKLAEEFAKTKGRRPTKREVEIMVRESRGAKLTEVSTAEVRRLQRAQLTPEEASALHDMVRRAKCAHARQSVSKGVARDVLESTLRHAFERRSVIREGELLASALELFPEFNEWRQLREALQSHADVLARHGELTLRSIRREEFAAVDRIRQGRATRVRLGRVDDLPPGLTAGQALAAGALLESKDSVLVLVGDAGTGKTTLLRAVEGAHQAFSGHRFIALAPTTRARDALSQAGFDHADTLQRFLVSEELQRVASRRVILIDEAGLLSTRQMDALTRIAGEQGARLLLVGDTKQHHSVERGDALRNVIRHADLPIVRLSEVMRQRRERDRRFSRLLAAGRMHDAFEFATRRGMVQESTDETSLFAQAADDYADNLARGVETVVVIPFWDEIERFNGAARDALRRRGLLGPTEVVRTAVRPLAWGEEQKVHWHLYRPGDRLLFVRDTRFFRRGTAGVVTEVLPNGLRVEGGQGRSERISAKQRGAFDVGRPQSLPLAAGDRILIRGRRTDLGFSNGDVRTVASIDPARGDVILSDGQALPSDFHAWTYGHAVTSYRAQGSTAEESILVLGTLAEQALQRRQFYVANTRFRGAHRIYVNRREAILRRLAVPDDGRELATDFMYRQGLTEAILPSPLRRLRSSLRRAWLGVAEYMERRRQSLREHVRR